jgi:hypothetical protein
MARTQLRRLRAAMRRSPALEPSDSEVAA